MLPVLTISTYKGRLLQPLRHQFENWRHLPLHRGDLGALRIDTAYHWTNSSAIPNLPNRRTIPSGSGWERKQTTFVTTCQRRLAAKFQFVYLLTKTDMHIVNEIYPTAASTSVSSKNRITSRLGRHTIPGPAAQKPRAIQ